MGMPEWLTGLLGGGVTKIVDSAAAAADRFVVTEEDRQKLALEFERLRIEAAKLAMEGEAAYFNDRASAREMYKQDNKLQKQFAITFLIGFILVTIALLSYIFFFAGRIALPEWATLMLGTIFGGILAKVQTIVDFLFGSSQGSKEKDEIVRHIQDSNK